MTTTTSIFDPTTGTAEQTGNWTLTDKDNTVLPNVDPRTAWIGNLTIEELKEETLKFGLDTLGTADALQERLTKFMTEGKRKPGMQSSSPIPSTSLEVNEGLPLRRHYMSNEAAVCDQVRKWGLHFDGSGNGIDFLERVEELRDSYGLTDASLLRGIPELFKGKVLLWARNNRKDWETWEDFLEDFRTYYFPADYRMQIEREIISRQQGNHEKVRDYVIGMQTMIRRHGGISKTIALKYIHQNLRVEFKKFILRDSVRTVNELLTRAEEQENFAEEEMRQSTSSRPPPNNGPSIGGRPRPMAPPASSRIRCYRCGGNGHMQNECRNPRKIFCWRCNKQNVLTKDCPCSGNE